MALTDGSLYNLKSLGCLGGGQSNNGLTERYWLFDLGRSEALKCLKGKKLGPMLSSSVQHIKEKRPRSCGQHQVRILTTRP